MNFINHPRSHVILRFAQNDMANLDRYCSSFVWSFNFMAISTDFHSHVSRSSALQMVQAAKEKGLLVLGLSEHDFQMSEARHLLDHLPIEGALMSFAEYGEAVREAGRVEQFDARLGMEVDYIPGKNEAIQAALHALEWDFLIGSVHEVDEVFFEKAQVESREEGEAMWLRYFALLREAVASGAFSLVSHPVRMRVKNVFLPATFDTELEQLAAEAARRDVALEINGYDVLSYPSLVRRLARACALHHTPISVGSDAHLPQGVAQSHAPTEELLREVGIAKIRTWKALEPQDYTF
jgi:histidinol-phosphatase (PHP family)